mgnify:CR=1 FL=1
MRIFLKVTVLILFAIGAFVVLLASKIESKYQMRNKETIKGSEQFEEKEIESLKKQKAVIRVKLYGLVFLIPGMIGILIMFD